MDTIKIGIIGVGNCASALVQGLGYYRTRDSDDAIGLMHWDLGGYLPCDIEVVLAYDIDARKVGQDLNSAIHQPPNCTKVFYRDDSDYGVTVQMGRVLDGYSEHMGLYPESETFVISEQPEASQMDVVAAIRDSGAEILVNYLPVGSEQATHFYVEAALEAGVGFVNCIPVFIASDPAWAQKFEQAKVPIIGDDVKSQLGATIVHRTLSDLFEIRGVTIDRSYQINTAGNTDFLNMLNRNRLESKKISKTEAVKAVATYTDPNHNLHVSPSDYVAWQDDNKVCFIRMEGRIFGDTPIDLELRLSVEDSPNSAGVVIDAIRCCKLALKNGLGGALIEPSAYFCKHPAQQFTDSQAFVLCEAFVEAHS
ncbi:MAG: inositol-3-phosphate synthase [Propionibacteriaceae bacterium]|nr:inositol-3-phosphate synthase [Propionibacteriaceae bacterium]